MTDADHAAFGLSGTWTVQRHHRVRWSECDMLRHVNNAAYLEWFEDLRVTWWDQAGRASGGVGIVLGEMTVRYIRPVHFRDEVLLTLRTVSIRRASFVQEYGVWRDGLACSCRATCVGVAPGRPGATPFPEAVRRHLIENEGTIDELAGAAR